MPSGLLTSSGQQNGTTSAQVVAVECTRNQPSDEKVDLITFCDRVGKIPKRATAPAPTWTNTIVPRKWETFTSSDAVEQLTPAIRP
jgi:hypothetical protein